MNVSEIKIPQMFTAYAERLGCVNQLNHTQYFCEECDQAFASAWGVSPGSMSMYERGTYFHCTYCGKQHYKNVAYLKNNEYCPNKVRLSLKTFKDLVVLEVYYDAVFFDGAYRVRSRRGKETFRFDIAKQTATFNSWLNKSPVHAIDIGNPFELDLFQDSILRFFTADSLVVTNRKPELVAFIKELREAVQNKMEKHFGHKIKSMYVSSGTRHGMFLTPLKNIAFRVTFPDAHNLSEMYREHISDIKVMWERHLITDYSFIQQAMSIARKGTDFITAVITSTGLPNKAAVRREIEKDFFEYRRLVESFNLVKNYDYAIRMYTTIKLILNKQQARLDMKNLFNFLHGMLVKYGESGLVDLAENAEKINIDDCSRLYDQLTKDSKRTLMDESIRIRDLHNWMAKKHREQGHKNLILDVPDYIINRLSMQKEQIKFFLPKESRELVAAGKELHNCVASYAVAMEGHKKWIVLVANDKGKLVACLEVVGNALVQAKLINNQRLAKDDQLNTEVISWAEKANIDIKTHDVTIPIAKQVISA